jgi:hypothetical protein
LRIVTLFAPVLGWTKHNLAVKRQSLKDQIESIAIGVGERPADVTPPIVLAFALDNGVGMIDQICRILGYDQPSFPVAACCEEARTRSVMRACLSKPMELVDRDICGSKVASHIKGTLSG